MLYTENQKNRDIHVSPNCEVETLCQCLKTEAILHAHGLFISPQFDSSDTSVWKKARRTN